MSLPSPNLDDRTFGQLVEEARQRIRQMAPEWTDLSPGDPGITLVELFAYLTESMLYRLNRLPEKAYVEFLNLIGVKLQPPAAASVQLTFSRPDNAAQRSVEIRRGTRVTVSRSEGSQEAPIFITDATIALGPGETTADVLAYHAEPVEAELAGTGTGLPGQVVRVRRPPIVATAGDDLSLVVALETPPEELTEQEPVLQYGDRVYRVWQEVDNFSDYGPEDRVYLADRRAGAITFAPAARMRGPGGGPLEESPQTLAAVPPAGREIRVWYRRGGGPEGNVAAGTLTVLKDPVRGVAVTNAHPATGGQAGETLQNALIRGPQELHSLNRAVTARDFELLALSSARAVARARALTRAAMWSHAAPGTVEVLLVPHLPESQGAATAALLRERETATAREAVWRALEARRPLGTGLVVNWAHYKTVRVTARIVVRRYEDQAAVRDRVLERLRGVLTPLPTAYSPNGWPFGQALRASHIYDIALAEPGVLWVDRVRLHVAEVPGANVGALTADAHQPQTWYAGSASALFRTTNNGEGWEPLRQFEGEQVQVIRSHPEIAGVLAVVTGLGEGTGARIHISRDCGESWDETAQTTAFAIHDAAWMVRDSAPILLLATDAGLYELALDAGSSPVQVLVEPQDQDLSFYAVAAAVDVRGEVNVAAAAQGTRGIYLSSTGGRPNTFRRIGLEGQDVRTLGIQRLGPRLFLWGGQAAVGGDPGNGCHRWELRGAEDPPEGWETYKQGWAGGSCRDLAFVGEVVVAGTHRAGVVMLDASQRDPIWQAPDVRCGLPLRDPGRFHPVDAVAARAGEGAPLVMSGGVEGIHLTRDGGERYTSVSESVFSDKMTLPPTWLFCSGDHEIEVASEGDVEGD